VSDVVWVWPRTVKARRRAYYTQRRASRSKGISWDLTFEEWQAVWEASGRCEQRGRHAGEYCLCRTDHTGPFSVANVRIRLFSDVRRAANTSAAWRRMQSEKAVGRRAVLRDGRRTWAYPGDPDYPARG
jgi:hypothetical protein